MSSGREWDEYFEELYGGIVTTEKIEEFAAKYRDSEEEKRDLIECYNTAKGDMDEIMVG
jgi:DnaJ family protein C protein 9